jgi:hypothetical protein
MAPLGLNTCVSFAMQVIVQRHKHSNRWGGVAQWKFAQFALKACRFLDLVNLKNCFF